LLGGAKGRGYMQNEMKRKSLDRDGSILLVTVKYEKLIVAGSDISI